VRLSVVERISDISPSDWSRLDPGRSPFMELPFLQALERSGSVGGHTGWQPLFLTARGDDGVLLGAVPAFIKSHSYGEYIFDWGWARGAQAAGIDYYPKLVIAAPFTPVTGRRILLAPEAGEDVARALAAATVDLAKQLKLSSVHWLFVTDEERELLADVGYLSRLTTQYHWENDGFADFDAFLGTMRSKRRREVRRERRQVIEAGIDVRMLTGPEMEDRHWVAVDDFYRHTCGRKWNDPYLEPGFFERIRETFAEQVVFCSAEQRGEVLAGSIFFRRGDALYGRYWGRREEVRVKGLHFDVCYYAPIEWAISQGIQLYEAGAQGEHKIARGFMPAAIHSAHWIADPRLAGGVARFLEDESNHTEVVMEVLEHRGPFRRGDDGPLPAGPAIAVDAPGAATAE